MEKDLKLEIKSILEKSPLIEKIEVFEDYFKLFTNIKFSESDTFLNIYVVFENGNICLSDSNEIFRNLDDIVDVSNEKLSNLSREVGLDYSNYRITKIVTSENILAELEKFNKLLSFFD